MINAGLAIEHEEVKGDRELVFDGPAEEEVVTAWSNRLDRMIVLQQFFGEQFAQAKAQFLNTLRSTNHTSEAKINFLIGRKQPDLLQ